MEYIFVYGTLRLGELNHSLLEEAKLVSAAATVKGDLIDTGCGYPALLLGSNGLVCGEIYETDGECFRSG